MEDDNELIVSHSWTSQQLSVKVFCIYICTVCVLCLFVSTCVCTLYYVLCMIVTDTLYIEILWGVTMASLENGYKFANFIC